MKVVIVGNSEYAKLILGYLEENETMDVVAFSVEKQYVNEAEMCGLPVVAYEDIEKYYAAEEVRLVLAIGNKQLGKIREKLFYMYRDKGYHFINYIHPTAIVPKDLIIGMGNIIMEGVIISRQCSIGDGNLIWSGCIIGHDNHIENFNTFAAAKTSGFVTVRSNCFIGINATVRNGITINSSVLVGAASYVDADLDENSVVLPSKGSVMQGKGAQFLEGRI